MTVPEISKVVIPAAGLGTRCLPATKVIPKEMLPIVDRPLIQYAVEEAVASGATTVILVISSGKELLARHFDPSPKLEESLRQRGQFEDARKIHDLSKLAEIRVAYQPKPLGLANAIEAAIPLVGTEPFAVILPDALIDSQVPCIGQLIRCYERHRGCIVALREIADEEVERFGIVTVAPQDDPVKTDRALRVISLLERPQVTMTASRLGIFGRYVLTPDILSSIREIVPGRGGELQLTDALAHYALSKPVFGYLFEGEHYDAGSKVGFVQATLAFALKDSAISTTVDRLLAGVKTVHSCSA